MTAVLALNGVSRDFVQGDEVVHALTPTDLMVGAGEFVGVVGPSGSGKSTLLTLMGGLRRPTAGTVTINGEPFSALEERRRSRIRSQRIGFILQSAGLVPFLRIADQFTLHDRAEHSRARPRERDELLGELGIDRLGAKYPAELSGGERQRAAVAVALYHDPQVVLADEPTAALDTHRALGVAQILAEQTHGRGKATVMVTHDERLLGVCDRVLSMEDGTLSQR